MWPGFPAVFTVHALSRDVMESWQCPQQLLAMLTPPLMVKSICELKTGWEQWQPIQTELHSKRLLSLALDADLEGQSLSTLDHWVGHSRQSVFLPQDCFCGFTLNPSPLYARQAEENNTLREQELLQTEQTLCKIRSSDTCSAVGRCWWDVSWIITLVPFCPSLVWGWVGSTTP